MEIKSARKRKPIDLIVAPHRDPVVKLWMLRSLCVRNRIKPLLDGKASIKTEVLAYLELSQVSVSGEQFDAGLVLHSVIQMHRHAEQYSAVSDVSSLCKANIETVAQQLGLNRVEAKILDFALNIHVNKWLSSVLGMLEAPDFHNAPGILAAVLNEFEQDIRKALDPNGRLVSTGFLELQFNSLRAQDFDDIFTFMSPSIVQRMTMPLVSLVDLMDGVATSTMETTLEVTDFEYMQDDLQFMIMHLQKSLNDHRKGANILLYGAPGTGKTELSRLIAKCLGCELIEVAYESQGGYSLQGERRLRAFKLCQTVFSASRTIILFDEMEDAFGAEMDNVYGISLLPGKGLINQVIERAPVPSIWVTNHIHRVPASIVRRFDIVMKMGRPGRRQMLKAINHASDGWIDSQKLATLADIEDLSPATLKRAIDVVRFSGDSLPEADRVRFVTGLIDQSLKAQGMPGVFQSMKSELLTAYNPAMLNADADLLQCASGLRHSRNAKLFLHGPPGTGKTGFARWLSEHLDMPLIIKRASDLLRPYVGQTEHNLAEAFHQAKQQAAILLIDEIDSFLCDRSQAAHSWQVSLVNEMLTQIESFNGIFVATTNLPEHLDHASFRRFDLKIKLDYLRYEQALHMLGELCRMFDLPAPTALHQAALKRIERLTPGDFVTVARQQRFMATSSVEQIVSSLRKESELKIAGSVKLGLFN